MPELDAWEKVFIDDNSNGNGFLNSIHGPNYEGADNPTPHALSCQHCHGGGDDNTFNTMEEAHTDMIRDPSEIGVTGCTKCHNGENAFRSACDACHHVETVDSTINSLHTNLWGEKKSIEDRCGRDFDSLGVDEFFDAKCASCHTTCGQCHISRPNSVGGGFPKIGSYYSHSFKATPDMNEQCTACHGSRIGHDFKGEAEGNVADVHRSPNAMKCQACHSAEEIHGDGQYTGDHYEHRYEVATMPRCENCHQDDLDSGFGHIHHTGQDPDCGNCHHNGGTSCDACHDGGGAFAFTYPLPTMQCQVCHSQPYKNCTNCHNLVSGGKYEIEPSTLQLKIAQNPSPHREEYDFSLVRHTPISEGTYDDWNLDLPEYTSKSTWQYTSPHNILTNTPQTTVESGQSCTASCHGSPDGVNGYLLRESDLYEADGTTKLEDYDANFPYVIRDDFPATKELKK